MALLKFRIHPEEDDTVYRDVIIKHSQNFEALHNIILDAYLFDKKHEATFYRSTEDWRRGREISLQKYDKEYRAEPLLMRDTKIASEIFDTNQRFIYEYDFTKKWVFYVSLISVIREEDKTKQYPLVSRVEGTGPQQYKKGNAAMPGKQFIDIEEKYDLHKDAEGFGREGEGLEDMPTDTDDE
ncbi:plasmid pRiA4b ORF-3 family protein [Haoranjiania flava]|uniref:Plasmid pRiA4b ORF-3 family protein n=1 Tax=Haoranjiania flava TaxID=1856322 RepID=A0AAE3IQM9_9BACT|nr:plasmid pRiA4b ORF-3 family protein [Haoranjiania flava]MCU7695303.1 plasmid pRiA4b ORF-3 family protein [Haoranjiania flava]